MKIANVGGTLEDFFAELGELEEVRALAAKKMVAMQLGKLMTDRGISKPELARRMETSRSAVGRLLDPSDTAVTLATLAKASAALGTELDVTFRKTRAHVLKKESIPAASKARVRKKSSAPAPAKPATSTPKRAGGSSRRSFSR